MKKLVLLNYICLVLLTLTFLMSIKESYNSITSFGWEWTKTTIIGDQTYIEEVSGLGMLLSSGLIGVMSFSIFLNIRQLKGSVDLILVGDDASSEMCFLGTKPEFWSVASDNKNLIVQLDNYTIVIPHETILNLRKRKEEEQK